MTLPTFAVNVLDRMGRGLVSAGAAVRSLVEVAGLPHHEALRLVLAEPRRDGALPARAGAGRGHMRRGARTRGR